MAARHYLKHINKKIEDLKIPDFFDKETWVCGKTYDVKVSHIYSPSVIWIVTKHRELNLFFKVMNKFYHKSYKDWSLAEEKIQKGLYCTVYVDGAFYRALVKQITLTTSGVVGIKVFLIDFGSLASVTSENIFQLKESMLKLPCFCVRASLWNIKPKHVMWQQEEINRLSEWVKSASTVAIVDFIDKNLKTLRIRIGLCENNLNVTDLSEKLIKECQVNSLIKKNVNKISRDKKLKYTFLVKHQYLFPSHYELENGLVPNSLTLSEQLRETVPLDKLYPLLYKYNT